VSTLHFRILGPIECSSAGAELDLGGPRQVKLLALLLVNANRALATDQLIEALWGAESVGNAPKRLQVAIVRLRKALGRGGAASRVQTVAGGYRLRVEPRELDADRFSERVGHGRRALDAGEPVVASEFLRAALRLWRGPAFADVTYEPFAQAEIRRLEELRLAALTSRLDADLRLGRHVDVVSELESLTVEHPTHETLSRQFMLALYRCGRQADALDVFQRVRTNLREQFGLDPGPALCAMQAHVLGQHPALELRGDPDRAPRRSQRSGQPGGPAFLIVRPGAADQRVVTLDPFRQSTLGRSTSVDVPLPWDAKVSRLHAAVERVGDAWMVIDDGLSRNGTFCNDEPVRGRTRLSDGDVLRFGDTLAVFREESEPRTDATVSGALIAQ
jgi:DNA-binding SARP family transcriptional activator